MLKVVESEFLRNYYMIHRLVLMFTRTRGIPKQEPSGTQVSGKHEGRRFLNNDVQAYQESQDVILNLYL